MINIRKEKKKKYITSNEAVEENGIKVDAQVATLWEPG